MEVRKAAGEARVAAVADGDARLHEIADIECDAVPVRWPYSATVPSAWRTCTRLASASPVEVSGKRSTTRTTSPARAAVTVVPIGMSKS